jgi:hypothetical protein
MTLSLNGAADTVLGFHDGQRSSFSNVRAATR